MASQRIRGSFCQSLTTYAASLNEYATLFAGDAELLQKAMLVMAKNMQQKAAELSKPIKSNAMIKEAKMLVVSCDRCGVQLQIEKGKEHFASFSEAETEAARAGWAKVSSRWYCPGCFTRNESGNAVVKPNNH